MEENIIIKGTQQKNKPAHIIIIVSSVLLLISVFAASYEFKMSKRYYSFWSYSDTFGEFFVENFFDYGYGYMIMLGVIALVVGIIMKTSTEKCEITVTREAVLGKIPHGKAVHIPLNQITTINRSSFNGVSITYVGNVSNFYCIENCEEVMKALSYLLTTPQQNIAQPTQSASTNDSEAERLKKLKDLLDSGVLTQEEFESKKKQIIGL